jgi:pimeloyl-ACP methyl ester carboxylesterase
MKRSGIETVEPTYHSRVSRPLNYDFSGKRQMVIIVPGINDSTSWPEELRLTLSGYANVFPIVVSFGFIKTRRFVFDLFCDNFSEYVRSLREDLESAMRTLRPDKVVVIAHSFGTYVLSLYLRSYADIPIDGIILAGSILPKSFKWHFLGPSLSFVINDCAQRDKIPIVAENASSRLGSSGRYGFSSWRAFNRYHESIGHQRCIYLFDGTDNSLCEEYLRPIFEEGLLVENEERIVHVDKMNWTNIGVYLFSLAGKPFSRAFRAARLMWSGKC